MKTKPFQAMGAAKRTRHRPMRFLFPKVGCGRGIESDDLAFHRLTKELAIEICDATILTGRKLFVNAPKWAARVRVDRKRVAFGRTELRSTDLQKAGLNEVID